MDTEVQGNEKYLKVIEWCASILSIVGAFFISFGFMVGFLLWLISNIMLILWSIKKRAYGLTLMQVFFLVTSIIGTVRWLT